MRVLGFCDYYSPDSCGGSERVAREVYRRLATDHGIDVTDVGGVPVPPGDRAGIGRENEQGVRSVLVPAHDLSARVGVQLLVSRRLPRAATELVTSWKPDVMHANSLHFQSTLVAAALARRHRIPLITTAHLAGNEGLDLGLRLAATGWDQTVGRTAVAASTAMVAVSNAVAAHVRTLGLGRRPMTVAYNGVDHDVFHARGRRDECGPAAPLRVGFVGRLITNKGPDLFLRGAIQALAAGANLQLVIVGAGPMRADLQALALDPLLRGRIEFTGQVNDVAQRMRELDVVVRSSYTEGLPLAVVEAMASGAVVVASDVPGNLELVSHRRTGYVFPAGNSAKLAEALQVLARDRAQLAVLRDAALKRAVQFSWARSAACHRDAFLGARSLHSRPVEHHIGHLARRA